MPTQAQLNEWNDAFTRIQRVESHRKMKAHLTLIEQQINNLTENIGSFKPPRNAREDMHQHHDKLNREMLIKQKIRIETTVSELEKQIQNDMETVK